MAGNDVKYQVFISSTYEDLKEEREAVTRAVLEMGHIPVGMEMFSAGDEEQWEIIARHIEASDYYAVILAHRLGSLTPEGVSFTRKEYEYAKCEGIPCLGFVIDSTTSWPADRVDRQTGASQALQEFKDLVQEKPVSFWKSASDLHSKFAISLVKAIVASPRDGWTRSSDANSGRVLASEVARLSAENGALRAKVAQMEKSSDAVHAAEKRETLRILAGSARVPSYRYSPRGKWQADAQVTLLYIFQVLGPEMVIEAELDDLADTLAMAVRRDKESSWDIVALNHVKSYLADLMTLELVRPSPKKHSVSDTKEYWSLSPYGMEMLKDVHKARLMKAGVEPPEETDSAGGSVDASSAAAIEDLQGSKRSSGPLDLN